MPKNIVLCCDGTSNEPATDKTNVAKLYYTLVNDPARQVTYYHPGLGTMEPPGALTRWQKFVTRKRGLALGSGLDLDVRDACVYLAETFVPGDKLFLFGFSRGAYTVRVVTSLLKLYGLVERGNGPLVPYAFRMMDAINRAEKRNDRATADQVFALAESFRGNFSRVCKPWFVGVWDTVSSVGWLAHPKRYPFTADNPDIAIGRHAIAMDERRAFFPANLWRHSPALAQHGPADLKQVWFPGSHGDVGGGYPESESEQSKFALEWMLVEARSFGLLVDVSKAKEILGAPGSRYVAPGVGRPIHDSLTGYWKLAEYVRKPHYDYATGQESRRMNLGRRREIVLPCRIHASAYLRGPAYAKFIPAGAVEEPHVAL